MNGAEYLKIADGTNKSAKTGSGQFQKTVSELLFEIIADLEIDFVYANEETAHFAVDFPNDGPTKDYYIELIEDEEDDKQEKE